MTPADVREICVAAETARGSLEGYDICIGGGQRGPDWEKERDHVRAIAAAGATWWQEWLGPVELNTMREAIGRGPIRID